MDDNKHLRFVDAVRSLPRAKQVEVIAKILARLARRAEVLAEVVEYAESEIPDKKKIEVPK